MQIAAMKAHAGRTPYQVSLNETDRPSTTRSGSADQCMRLSSNLLDAAVPMTPRNEPNLPCSVATALE